jgi:HSP20 family protein
VNVRETADDFAIELAAPGMKKEDFKVEVENDLLTISSEKEHKEEKESDGYSRKEFSYASFSRSFTLPKSVLGDQISATYEDGVLHLRLPKREEAKLKAPRLVKIS